MRYLYIVVIITPIIKSLRIKGEGVKMKCFKCQYDWSSRVNTPKSCPRCKTRLDYKNGALEE